MGRIFGVQIQIAGQTLQVITSFINWNNRSAI